MIQRIVYSNSWPRLFLRYETNSTQVFFFKFTFTLSCKNTPYYILNTFMILKQKHLIIIYEWNCQKFWVFQIIWTFLIHDQTEHIPKIAVYCMTVHEANTLRNTHTLTENRIQLGSYARTTKSTKVIQSNQLYFFMFHFLNNWYILLYGSFSYKFNSVTYDIHKK